MSFANAQNSCNVLERAACTEALDKADKIIANEDKLVLVLKGQLESEQEANKVLSKALVELQAIDNHALERELTFGLSGTMLGIIATLLLKH